MAIFVVLFNLKKGVDPAAYENWARTTDIPTVRTLPSIGGFEALKTTGLMGSDGTAPYQYIEIIDVKDMDQFVVDVETETMKRVAAEFQEFADNPLFVMTENLDTGAA